MKNHDPDDELFVPIDPPKAPTLNDVLEEFFTVHVWGEDEPTEEPESEEDQ